MNKLTLLLVSLLPAAALAQPAGGKASAARRPAVKPAAPAMPAPPPEVKATVDAFKGSWRFKSTLTMPGAPKPMAMNMTYRCKPIVGGVAVACDADARTPMGPVKGHYVIAYDPYSKAVHFRSVTNMFEVHDHVCTWKSSTELTCAPLKAGSGPAGDEVVEEITMTWTTPRAILFKSTSRMANGGAIVFEGTGKR